MRLKCSDCGERVRHVLGSYEILATSSLRFNRDGATLKPAVAPLEISSQSLRVDQVTCSLCGYIGPLETWTVVVDCDGCGNFLAEFPAATSIPVVELYCAREGSFVCRSCALRYGACGTCANRSTCPIINKEE